MLQHFTGHLKKLKFSRNATEGFVFYLHYRVTFLLLMACCIVITSQLHVGEPIVCTATLEVTAEVMASYCWAHATYSVLSAYNKKPGKEVPYPGIDLSEEESHYVYRDYYQWIYIVLFIQGMFFYIPHGVWKSFENGRMQQIYEAIQDPPDMQNSESQQATGTETNGTPASESSESRRLRAAARYLAKRWKGHNTYAMAYHFCEFLGFLNVLLQFILLDSLFQGEFLALGTKAISYFGSRHFHDNPLSLIFPRVTKCHFYKFGSSGKIDTVDVLCVLPINALSEKIYLFLWFWFVGLLTMTTVVMLLALLTICFRRIRMARLLFIAKAKQSSRLQEVSEEIKRLVNLSNYGDWFILACLSQKLDVFQYKTILNYLLNELNAATKGRASVSQPILHSRDNPRTLQKAAIMV